MKKKTDKAQKTEALLEKAGAKLKKQTKKLAEKQLLADEETYRTLFNKAADSIYLIDPKTESIIDCNPKASETTGYTLKQLRDKKMNELFPQEEQIIVSSILNKLNEAGTLSDIAGIHLLKTSGELVPVEINATTIKLGGKKFSLGIFRDISARNKVEEELKKSRERYQSLFQHMFIGCALHKIILDKNDRPVDYEFLQVNDAFVKLTGLKRADVIGKRVTEVIPEIEKSEFDWIGKYGEIALEGGNLQFEQYSEPLKKWFAISAYRPMEDHFIAMFEDISDRVLAENALRNSELNYRNLVDNSLVGIFKSNLKGKILYVNEASARMFDYQSPEELMSVGALLHYKNPYDREMFIRQLKKKGKVTNYELKVLTKSDTTKHILLNATLDGDVISGMVMDISERKELEEKLLSSTITDDLTGLFNRHGFLTMAEQQCMLTDRSRNEIFLLYLDLDNLKIINDRFGHEAGDQALIDITSILKNSFRKSDIIGRIGGDEFAVLLTASSRSANKDVIIKHVKNKIVQHNKEGSNGYDLSVSMGIAHHDPKNPCSVMELISKADAFMYKEKREKLEKQFISSFTNGWTEKRKYLRFNTTERCRVELEDNTGHARIKNISLGGICLETRKEMKVGKLHRIKTISCGDKSATTNCIVMWSTSSQGNGPETSARFDSGLKFTGLNEREIQSLDSVINDTITP
jgi:diguanylate cyclase (GGDEF)-like protein/PAS domain S-box-containing protein